MAKISKVKAREILDSRGNPTVEVDLAFDDDSFGRAAVPSGASTGTYEAVELRDGEKERYLGKGVTKAVENVEKIIAGRTKGFVGNKQRDFDKFLCDMDGSPSKGKLGANAILGVSMAYAKASAASEKLPLYSYLAKSLNRTPELLPVPMMNILNGGRHADNNIDIQEFMIVPAGAPTFKDAVRMGAEVFHNLKEILKSKGLSTSVGDEGGFAPNLNSSQQAIEVILEAILKAGYKEGKDIYIALDVAASELYIDGIYGLNTGDSTAETADEVTAYYEKLLTEYPVISIEDGLAEEDWDGWKYMTGRLKDRVQLVGDDIFVTNVLRLKRGIDNKIGNSILIKVNQIGTLSETFDAIEMARKAGYTSVISHRSGETEDVTISDITVATGAGQIKAGSLARTDRVCKYNQLLRIEEELGAAARYAGIGAFKIT